MATLIAGSTLASARDSGDAPKGAHDYQLNIIGMEKGKDAAMTGDNGNRIFVSLGNSGEVARTKIMLFDSTAGDGDGGYYVGDANGTDGEASFYMPPPGYGSYIIDECDPDCDVVSDYSIFIRPLGKPGGFATITTCADLLDSNFSSVLNGKTLKSITNNVVGDPDGNPTYCSVDPIGGTITERSGGKSKWTNVTGDLTSVVFEVTYDDGGEDVKVQIRVPIFDEALENEYWQYDNQGLRLLQVRFYDCTTNVETNESDCEF